jgi:hypothetical protein
MSGGRSCRTWGTLSTTTTDNRFINTRLCRGRSLKQPLKGFAGLHRIAACFQLTLSVDYWHTLVVRWLDDKDQPVT